MFSHETFDGDGRALSGACGPISFAGDGRLRLPWHEQRQAVDWDGETSVSARGKVERARIGTEKRGSDALAVAGRSFMRLAKTRLLSPTSRLHPISARPAWKRG